MKKVIITLITLVMVASCVCGYFAYEEKRTEEIRELRLQQKVEERKEELRTLPCGETLIGYFDAGYTVNVRYITGVEDIIVGKCHVYENISAGEICRLIETYGDDLRITAIEPNSYSPTNLVRYW